MLCIKKRRIHSNRYGVFLSNQLFNDQLHPTVPDARPDLVSDSDHNGFFQLVLRFYPSESFFLCYSMVRMSTKPVTSKTSIMVSLTWVIFMLPCLFITFWVLSSTRSPAEEM